MNATDHALARTERLAELRAEAEARLRAAVVEAVAEGCPVAPLARAAGVTRPTVYRWVDAAK